MRSLAMKARLVGVAAAVLSLSLGAAAVADPTPAPSAPPPVSVPNIPGVPSSIMNSPVVQSILNAAGGLLQTTNGPTARGKVTYFKRYEMQLQTAPGVFRQVHLHQGTVINPRGGTPATGMLVDVSGSTQGDGSLNANTITLDR
jgi:hypothetical protein